MGLIGGTSWVSTIDYYRTINQLTNQQLGGLNSAKILMYSVNYQQFKEIADAGEWGKEGDILSDIAKQLQQAGADCVLLCANTMHMVADKVQQNITIPLIHIAEVTAKEISNQGISKVGLLGTKFTMEQTFFKTRLTKYGIETLIPNEADRDFLHASIFNELGKGIFKSETKEKYLQIIEDLQKRGATGIIFGCTEIPLLIPASECNYPVFDTMLIHAKAAVDFALGL